jgi:putative FmdB family regulatory protein
MPIYEYECRGCGHRFEKIVYGGAAPDCPTCRSADVEKLLSTFAVASGGSKSTGDASSSCGTCGDPRGPGACSLN